MTTRVFIAGSMNIKHLDPKVKERIDNIVTQDFDVVLGDADGADTSIQQYLVNRGMTRAVVFCSGERPRNNVGHWPVQCVETRHSQGSRAFFTVKDIRMAEVTDIGLMIWDTKSVNQRAVFASDQHEFLPIVLMPSYIVCGSLTISKC